MSAQQRWKPAWVGEGYGDGGIRGQSPSLFYDSQGRQIKKCLWHEERTYRAFCWSCKYLLRFKGLSEVECPKCGNLNDVR